MCDREGESVYGNQRDRASEIEWPCACACERDGARKSDRVSTCLCLCEKER